MGNWFSGRRKPSGARTQQGALPLWRGKPLSRQQQIARGLGVLLAAVSLCGFLDLRGFHDLEQSAYSARLGVYWRRHGSFVQWAKQHILLVTYSEETCRKLHDWPPPRDTHARVIRELTRAGARIIAFDCTFDLPKTGDRELAAAARASNCVLWGCAFDREHTPDQSITLPAEQLRQAAPRWGHMNVLPDPHTLAVNRIEAAIPDRGRPVPALSVATARMWLGLEQQPMRRVAEGWQIGSGTLPVDADGCFRISFLGEPGQVFLTFPYEEVHGGALDDPFYRENRIVQDRIVLIGNIMNAVSDHRPTPVGEMWGVEIHAHAIATLLRSGVVREAPAWAHASALGLSAVLAGALAAALPLLPAAAAVILLLVGYGLFNTWLFVDRGMFLHLIGPTAAMALTAIGLLVDRGWAEERRRRHMHALLQRYVSPQIARHILANPDAYALGSERVTVTVLFSDIRGFTTMSEAMAPAAVVAMLNEYYGRMVAIVNDYDGTLMQYVGDELMGVWGAPAAQPDHALRAVRAGLEMLAELRALNVGWRERGLPTFEIGIGIHSGEAAAGNIGSSEREQYLYPVVGDTVNTASRVEQLNKEFGTHMILTEATYHLVQDLVEARPLPPMEIRGKAQPVTVFEVLGLRSDG